MSNETYRFKVGALECIAVSDGILHPELNASFFYANAPKERLVQILHKHNLQREQFVPLPCHCLVIDTTEHLVLVDTGRGKGASPSIGKLLQNLKSEGIEPSDIDTVIITHGHRDHICGNIDAEGKPVFPNARYFISKDEWEFWTSEIDPTQWVRNMADDVRKQLLPLQSQLHLFDQDGELVPGIHTVAAPGHTPGHTAVSVSSKGAELLHISDLVVCRIHLEQPDWYMAHEVLPGQAVSSRRRLLEIAATRKLLVFAFHLPFPGLGHVTQKQDGWQWQPIRMTD